MMIDGQTVGASAIPLLNGLMEAVVPYFSDLWDCMGRGAIIPVNLHTLAVSQESRKGRDRQGNPGEGEVDVYV